VKITALLPCRAGSQRIENKNIRPFADSSLIDIKLNQLLSAKGIDEVLVSTDDEKVIDICQNRNNPKIKIQKREKYFAGNDCSTDELAQYFIRTLDFEYLLWTHVTSPFIDEDVYQRAIATHRDKTKEGFDSLLSVHRCQEFVWDESFRSVNYDRVKDGIWPKTQNIKPVFIINSGIFLASRDVMVSNRNRIGRNPFYFETNIVEGFDIDWEKDFILAEKMWKALKK